LLGGFGFSWAEMGSPLPPGNQAPFGTAERIGFIEDHRLLECSGLEASPMNSRLFWAVNDGGNGPFLYALGLSGGSRGRVLVAEAKNRDWEGLETFLWQGRPMILIADFGDNAQRHATHTLYIVHEPERNKKHDDESAVARVAWRIVFSYPDRNHDAEGVAVDPVGEKVFVLTKRDHPPLLFELPLKPPSTNPPVVAKRVGEVTRIPPPSAEDLTKKYGIFRSQPTALDLSADGRYAVVLTYKHAYLFKRHNQDSWAAALAGNPITIPLPPPDEQSDFRQREAICFAEDGRALFVTSEGRGAGIYRLKAR
jgi:hypothetical protein